MKVKDIINYYVNIQDFIRRSYDEQERVELYKLLDKFENTNIQVEDKEMKRAIEQSFF